MEAIIERAVELRAGSKVFAGFRLDDRLVLTAHHRSREQEPSEARVYGSETVYECGTIWRAPEGKHSHFILLQLKGDPQPVGASSLGRFAGGGMWHSLSSRIWRGVEDVGAPTVQHVRGMLDVDAFGGSALYEFLASPPWVDLTYGAAVCCDDVLVGLIVSRNTNKTRFVTHNILPVESLSADKSFLDAVSQAGGTLGDGSVRVFEPDPEDVDTALKSVADADPANIQEVAGSSQSLIESYYKRALDEARRSFDWAILSAAIGLAFFVASILFSLFTGRLTAPLVSATAGGVVELVSGLNFWLYARSASQLNVFHRRLERTQRVLLANSVAAGMDDEKRDVALKKIIKAVLRDEELRKDTA